MSRILLTASSTAADPGGPFAWFQELVGQVPEAVQPLVIALAGAVPFIEGEGSAALGIIGGVHPVVAALAGIVGNLLCVVVVVLLGSRIREALVRRRAGRGAQAAGAARAGSSGAGAGAGAGASVGVAATGGGSVSYSAAPGSVAPESVVAGSVAPRSVGGPGSTPDPVSAGSVEPTEAVPEKKGKAKLRRWLVKFGVPGASLLAPLALPTMFTAATFVGSGVSKGWVILWQAVAIVVWTTVITLLATGLLSAIG